MHVAVARVALHEGRQADAHAALLRVHRLRPLLDHGLPWLSIQVGLELTRAHLALGEAAAARTVLTETEQVLERRPTSAPRPGGTAARTRGGDLQLGRCPDDEPDGGRARLLPYLATHLTFLEIGQRLYLSQHTVKSEATSIYRKLNASTRSTAIERAIQVGLLESTIYPPQPNRRLKAWRHSSRDATLVIGQHSSDRYCSSALCCSGAGVRGRRWPPPPSRRCNRSGAALAELHLLWGMRPHPGMAEG